MADERFLPWFKLQLFALNGNDSDRPQLEAALKTLMPIDRNFYQADVRVVMRYNLNTANHFEVKIAGLSRSVYDAIKLQKTGIRINLGYATGDDKKVLEGVVMQKSAVTGDCFYETVLRGVEAAYHKLQKTRICDTNFDNQDPISRVLRSIESSSQVFVDPAGIDGSEPRLSRDWSADRQTAISLLSRVAARLRRVENYTVLVRDNKIRYAGRRGDNNNIGDRIPTQFTYDNYLVKTKPVQKQRRPRHDRCESDSEEERPPPIGCDFEMLGDPNLKAGDTVVLHYKDNAAGPAVAHTLTIESITHDFSRERGYICKGRALDADQFLEHVLGSMAPSAENVGDEVNNLLNRNRQRSPAVNVGDVTEYTPQDHLVNATLGLEFEPEMPSPSIQAPRGAEGFTLQRRPIASPFAWNLCGLVVPVYPGMRAVAVHNRYLREDALLSGFVWTEEMSPPPNQAGDYWLCLPLDVPDDRPPNNTDKAANDLTTGDGKRVIQLRGLRLTIGEGLLEDLNRRPQDVGANDELQIEHSSGAKITMKSNEIKLEASERTISISNNKVQIS